LENIAKITFIISVAAFVAASATVAAVSGAVRISAPVKSSFAPLENEKLYRIANSINRSAPAMLLPKALDKAAADESKRRAADTAARKAALAAMQRGVIRLR
jgi:hypothetical protein